MLDNFPANHSKEREAMIINAVQDDKAEIVWATIHSEHNNHQATFYVFADAMKIDGIRVNVTAETSQKIADMTNSMLLTSKLADLIWHNADVRISPKPRPITSTTKAMIEHSQIIDKSLSKFGKPYGLISTVGKHWILDARMQNPRMPNQAVNYGWHFKGNACQGLQGNVNSSLLKDPDNGMYWKLIQSEGFFHNSTHSDYSQTLVLVSRKCLVDGDVMDLQDVLTHPEYSYLASNQGPLPILRQPGT